MCGDADELTAMVVRLKDGENLTRPHRRHLYQMWANEKHLPHWQVSVLYGPIQLGIGLSVIFLLKSRLAADSNPLGDLFRRLQRSQLFPAGVPDSKSGLISPFKC
jgi:hypothetical protein